MTTTTTRSQTVERRSSVQSVPVPKGGGTPSALELNLLQMRRMAFVSTVLAVALGSVAGMCIYLQGCESEVFRKEAERNYLRLLRVDTQRGDIFDRNREPLATSVEVDSVYGNPQEIESMAMAAVAQRLSEILSDTPAEGIVKSLTSGNERTQFAWIRRQITEEEAKKLRPLVTPRTVEVNGKKKQLPAELPGIYLIRESQRFYPKVDMAGQLLGVVGLESVGQDGLELAFDETLKGGRLSAQYHRDAVGRSAMLEGLPPWESKAGHSIVLTIDEKIQAVAERELERGCLSSLAAKGGIAVVMDVATGDLLAVAHYPRFNPNRYREEIAEAPETAKNRALRDMIEPGSTFKIVTLAAGLEEGVVGLDDVIDTQNGVMHFGKASIHDTHRYQKLSLRDVFMHSSNIGMAKVGLTLGGDKLREYIKAFGFGDPTHVVPGLPDRAGLVQKAYMMKGFTLANVAFGQGTAVTAVQMTAAVAAIGNGGMLMKPRLVAEELDAQGEVVRSFPPERVRRVVSVATAKQVLEAMKSVVTVEGTGFAAWMYDYDVAGKTGTAQKPDHKTHSYLENAWISSFVGVLPAERPRIAVLVLIDEPQGTHYGGLVAGPVFRKIAEWTAHYLQVPPSYGKRERATRVRPIPSAHDTTREAIAGAEGAYYDYPDGRVPGVDPMQPLSATVPELRGLTIREAAALAIRHNLFIDIQGAGRSVRQAVPKDTPLDPWSRVTVWFEEDLAHPEPADAPEDDADDDLLEAPAGPAGQKEHP